MVGRREGLEQLGEGRGLNGWEEGGAGTVGRREGPERLGGGREGFM